MRFIKLKMKIVSSILFFSVMLIPIAAHPLAFESTKESEAFERGDLNAVKRILKKTPRDYEDPEIVQQALYKAIESGNIELVKYLKSRGWLDVCRKAKRCSPIYIASYGKSIPMIKFFMAEGWSVKNLKHGKISALILAAKDGHANVVKFLLDQDINKNIRDSTFKKTALEHAIDRPYFMYTNVGPKERMEKNADIALIIEYLVGQDKQLMAKAFPTIVSRYPVKKIQYFEKLGWLQACADDAQCLPIHRAARSGHYGAVKYLIKKNFSVTAKDKMGNTPLHIIAHSRNPSLLVTRMSIARLLCEKGVDVNAHDKLNKTALKDALYRVKLRNLYDNEHKEKARIKSLTELIKYLQSGQCKKK